MITQSRLMELLDYDPQTGIFRWKSTPCAPVQAGREAGNVNNRGYRVIGVDNARYTAHRLAWLYVHGEFPSKHIDHLNGQYGDNRICNLRVVSAAENALNKKIPSNNKSGVIGVCWDDGREQWRARIRKGRKTFSLTRTADFFEAVCSRKSAEARMGFHPNHGRAEAPGREPKRGRK